MNLHLFAHAAVLKLLARTAGARIVAAEFVTTVSDRGDSLLGGSSFLRSFEITLLFSKQR
jgi:hypothetical protein